MLPSLRPEPQLNDGQLPLPFQCTSADLFSCQGFDFLVYVECLTGWPCIACTGWPCIACTGWPCIACTGWPCIACTGWPCIACTGWPCIARTGWPCIACTGCATSSCDVIVHFRRWFTDIVVPSVLCTDGGPQFSSSKFREFCKRWQVTHIMSSPRYPQSNGHAEAAVKAMKGLVLETTHNGDIDLG